MSPREAIAEQFHMSEGLLMSLNPGEAVRQSGGDHFGGQRVKPDV